MIKNVKTKQRMDYIDGIKGILCFLIMLGHYWNIYRGCKDNGIIENSFFEFFMNPFFNKTILSATFWLYAFLVISGYLLSETQIQKGSDLLFRFVNRFLRFYVPILGACIFIFVLQETIGFHVQETDEYFINTWFQQYYNQDLQWISIFMESYRALFEGSCKFNAPFWVIKDMFLASLFIYVCNHVNYLLKRKVHILAVCFLFCGILLDNHVMIACLAGYLVGSYKEDIKRIAEDTISFLAVSGVLCGGFLWLRLKHVLPHIFDKIFSIYYSIVFCWL